MPVEHGQVVTYPLEPGLDGEVNLVVSIGEAELQLPMLRLEDKVIFLFDPSEEHVKETGARAIVQLLSDNGFDGGALVTPESTKSVEMMKRVQEMLCESGIEVELVILKKDEFRDSDNGNGLSSEGYKSVKSDRMSVLRISPEEADLLNNWGEEKVWLIDDVGSTGATETAMRSLVNSNHPMVVVLDEQEALEADIVERELRVGYQPDNSALGLLGAALIPVLTDTNILESLSK